MLIINKDLEQVSLIFNAPEATSIRLHSDFTNGDTEIELGTNISPYPNRYSQFIVTDYSNLQTGLYQYELMSDSETVELGMLKVIATEIETDSYLTFPAIDDDLKIFNG